MCDVNYDRSGICQLDYLSLSICIKIIDIRRRPIMTGSRHQGIHIAQNCTTDPSRDAIVWSSNSFILSTHDMSDNSIATTP